MIPHELHYFEKLNSTHDLALEWVSSKKPPPFTSVMAGYQSAGKGRHHRVWQSEPDQNLLLSVIHYPQRLHVDRIYWIQQLATLTTIKLLTRYRIQATVKWPNDIYVNQKKIAGILVSNQLQGAHVKSSVVSLGLNVRHAPHRLSNQATSMAKMVRNLPSIEALARQWIHLLSEHWTELNTHPEGQNPYHEEWLQHLYGFKEELTFKWRGHYIQATLEDVAPNGDILLIHKSKSIHAKMDQINILINV